MAADRHATFNLNNAAVLLIDSEPTSLDMLIRTVQGFGVRSPRKAASGERARELCAGEPFDLILADTQLADMSGYDFVHELRRGGAPANASVPVLLMSAHTPASQVARSRDCGANFVVLKPLDPHVVLQRIVWIARCPRMFVTCDTYVGPDRRFRNLGPPLGLRGRREGDLSEHVGEAKEPNLSQADIDMLLPAPMRVSL